MTHASVSAVAFADDVEDAAGFDESEFVLDLRVIETVYPIGKLPCNTDDNCGSTCSGSACNTKANNPS